MSRGVFMKNFKPKKQEKDVVSIRMSIELLEQVDSIAAANDMSRNELIVQCIEYAIENIENK